LAAEHYRLSLRDAKEKTSSNGCRAGIPGVGCCPSKHPKPLTERAMRLNCARMRIHPYLPRQLWRIGWRPLRRAWSEWRRRRQVPMVVSQIARRPGTRVQFFLAHPEDILWCSGLVLALREQGAELALVCLTRGEGGELGGHPRERLGSVRERELRACAEVLGIDRVHFLGYSDPAPRAGVARLPQFLGKKLVEEVRDQIRRYHPEAIVTHGSAGEGWQPAHILVHDHVRKALREMRALHQSAPRLVTINAWDADHPLPDCLNEDDPPHLIVHAEKFADARLAAARCHESQLSLFEQFGSGDFDDFIRVTSHESYRVW
jgi:LmbE family N-acetylglucosaminyl deacetylase